MIRTYWFLRPRSRIIQSVTNLHYPGKCQKDLISNLCAYLSSGGLCFSYDDFALLFVAASTGETAKFNFLTRNVDLIHLQHHNNMIARLRLNNKKVEFGAVASSREVKFNLICFNPDRCRKSKRWRRQTIHVSDPLTVTRALHDSSPRDFLVSLWKKETGLACSIKTEDSSGRVLDS